MVEIIDEESARAWLAGKPREVQVAFAARAALRALPGIATTDDVKLGELVLPVVRASLISAVAAVRSTGILVDAAYSAADDADSAVEFAHSSYSYHSTAAAADAADLVVYSASSAAHSLSHSTTSAADSADAFWRAANRDAAHLDADETASLIFQNTLWPDAEAPATVNAQLDHVRTFWSTDRGQWGFWARWYDAMLMGQPLPWDLQESVSLISDQDWDAGAERVAERIREIEARFVAYTLKEDIAISDTGRLTLVPTPVDRFALLGHLLDTVEDALDLALTSRDNELTEQSHQVRIIRRALSRYGNDAQRLEMEFERARALHVTEMATDALPQSAGNRDLAQALADAASAIRDSDADIAKNRDKLNRIRLEQLSDEDGQKIAAVVVDVANASEGTLREDLLEDRFRLPGVRHDDGVPDPIVPLGAPERNAGIEAADAQIRIASRLSRIWIYVIENPGETFQFAAGLASIIGLVITVVAL